MAQPMLVGRYHALAPSPDGRARVVGLVDAEDAHERVMSWMQFVEVPSMVAVVRDGHGSQVALAVPLCLVLHRVDHVHLSDPI
jgi:hypothetical protein